MLLETTMDLTDVGDRAVNGLPGKFVQVAYCTKASSRQGKQGLRSSPHLAYQSLFVCEVGEDRGFWLSVI